MNEWTIKYIQKILLKISCLQSIYMVIISAKYSLRTFFFTSTKLGYEMYLNRLRS